MVLHLPYPEGGFGGTFNDVTKVLDHIRCEQIAKRVSGETPGGIFT